MPSTYTSRVVSELVATPIAARAPKVFLRASSPVITTIGPTVATELAVESLGSIATGQLTCAVNSPDLIPRPDMKAINSDLVRAEIHRNSL